MSIYSPYASTPQFNYCDLATTENLTSIYYNGHLNNGIGATLTSTSNGALIVDGVNASVNDRIVLAFQTNSAQNGIYLVTNTGSSSTLWVLTRSKDLQSASQAISGSYLFITNGESQIGKVFVVVQPNAVRMGFDPIIFGMAEEPGTFEVISTNDTITVTNPSEGTFSIGGGYTAGDNVTITGNVISAETGGSTVVEATNETILVTNPSEGVYSVAGGYTAGTGLNLNVNNFSVINPLSSQVYAGISGDIASSSVTSLPVSITGLTINSVVVAQIVNFTVGTPGSIVGTTISAGSFTITTDVIPHESASLIISYIVFISPQ